MSKWLKNELYFRLFKNHHTIGLMQNYNRLNRLLYKINIFTGQNKKGEISGKY